MNEQQQISLLDDTFRILLSKIRPYIPNLSYPQYITACRLWIEKLSLCKPEEGVVRNEYLSELYKQLKCGKIEEPFLDLPPDGPLKNIRCLSPESTSWSDISSTSTIATIEVPPSGDSREDEETITASKDNNLENDYYEKKLEEQQTVIDTLQMKNDFLTKQLSTHNSSFSTKSDVGLNMMTSEVEYLKERLKELIAMKKNLQTSHNAIILQWQDATQNLEYELREEKQKHQELQRKFNELEKKYLVIKSSNVIKCNSSRDLTRVNTEICNIEETHSDILKSIEEKNSILLREKEEEYDNKMKDIQLMYEERIENLHTEMNKEIRNRDEEISRLEKVVEEQCERSHIEQENNFNNESLVEKVTFLQNCILKMEKLLRKYERHYSKKISILTNELIMKDNSLQIQLTTQKAQLLAKVSSEKQTEIEDIVTQLEKRYRQLLEDQQHQVLEIRQNYLQLIKQIMEKFKIKNEY